MKARTLVSILAASLLAALVAMPGVAAAATKPAARSTPPSIDQEIVEQGSNGFQIKVSVRDRHRLELSATKIGRNLAIATANYDLPLRSQPDPSRISARIGNLGRVDMRFVPEKVNEVAPPGACSGGKIVEEEGFWIGLLAFHGEDGFTQVRVRSALGTVTKVPSLHCRPERPPNLKKLKRLLEKLEKEQAEEEKEEGQTEGEEEAQVVELAATARRHRVTFAASRLAEGRGDKRSSSSNLVAFGTRRRGRIKETGGVIDIFAPGSYFRPTDASDPTAEAIVKPPTPFSGTGTYRAHPKGPPTWTGDLKVELPGFGVVRLAGKGTRAKACEEPGLACGGDLAGRASSLLERLSRR